MSELQLRVESASRGDTPVLAGIVERLEDPREALEQVAQDVRDRQQTAFATAGFGTWAPNNPATIAAKAGGRVLVDTGNLLVSFTRAGARNSVTRITTDEVFVGSKDPVAALHRRGARGMPKRNPIPPTTRAERASWASGVGAYVVEGG